MTVIFDTGQIPTADRAEAVRAAVAETFVPVQIDFSPDGGPTSAHLAVTELGHMTICSVTSNAVTVQRTARLARDSLTPSVFMGLQVAGTSVVVQHGREVILRPGDLVLYDSTAPWALSDSDGIRQDKFRIPIDRLALPADVIRQICAVTLAPGHPIADLAATYFRRLALQPAMFDGPRGESISQPSIELLRAVITTHLDAVELATDALHATLVVRIMEYVRAHLREPDLSAGRIAAEHHVSVRQLYRILAAEGISLGDWIRAQRLEECRKDLAASMASDDPISVIARRWGFTDASSFARMFRAAYDISPRQWREMNRHRPL